MADYLVTGGAGFIGSHTVGALEARGARVRVLDDFSTGRPANLRSLESQIELVEGSVTDLRLLEQAMQGIRAVCHLAALPSVARSVADPEATHEVCATGTLRVLTAARAAGVRRVVYAASSSAYGDTARLPKEEDMLPGPLSPYAAAKLAGEHYCAAFTRTYGLDTVRLRYFNVFGPGQDPDSPYSAVIPRFIRALLDGRPPTIYGDGLQSRDFTYVDNVVHANLLALEAGGAAGQVFNIATGVRASLLDLVDYLNDILGTRIAPVHEPARAGDVRHSHASMARAASALGYTVRVSLREGLSRTVAHYRSQ